MKLRILMSGLQPARSRQPVMAPARPGVVDRVRGSTGVRDRERIRKRDEGQCQACIRERREHISIGVDVDHIKPLWDGGSDDDSNKELLCDEHHKAKSALEARQRARLGP